MSVYYNENDPFAAAWLAELMKDGLIPHGEIDTRSICDVKGSDLAGFTQLHFFAGIGGWAYALQLAGWPSTRRVATASAPCQPYSVASVGTGGAKGSGDSRDLWPESFRVIRELDIPELFGEQVADAIGWGWWDRAASDMESKGYAVAAAVLRADAFGAQHQRKRLYFAADARSTGWTGHQPLKRISEPTRTPLPVNGDPFVRARRALDGDFNDLLSCDGLSVVMERSALKGYGNAIVPQVAAEFISAYLDALN